MDENVSLTARGKGDFATRQLEINLPARQRRSYGSTSELLCRTPSYGRLLRLRSIAQCVFALMVEHGSVAAGFHEEQERAYWQDFSTHLQAMTGKRLKGRLGGGAGDAGMLAWNRTTDYCLRRT